MMDKQTAPFFESLLTAASNLSTNRSEMGDREAYSHAIWTICEGMDHVDIANMVRAINARLTKTPIKLGFYRPEEFPQDIGEHIDQISHIIGEGIRRDLEEEIAEQGHALAELDAIEPYQEVHYERTFVSVDGKDETIKLSDYVGEDETMEEVLEGLARMALQNSSMWKSRAEQTFNYCRAILENIEDYLNDTKVFVKPVSGLVTPITNLEDAIFYYCEYTGKDDKLVFQEYDIEERGNICLGAFAMYCVKHFQENKLAEAINHVGRKTARSIRAFAHGTDSYVRSLKDVVRKEVFEPGGIHTHGAGSFDKNVGSYSSHGEAPNAGPEMLLKFQWEKGEEANTQEGGIASAYTGGPTEITEWMGEDGSVLKMRRIMRLRGPGTDPDMSFAILYTPAIIPEHLEDEEDRPVVLEGTLDLRLGHATFTALSQLPDMDEVIDRLQEEE